jgi:hypothetical protein
MLPFTHAYPNDPFTLLDTLEDVSEEEVPDISV